MTIRKNSKPRSGFSLLEVMVSLAILAMIMTPVFALLRTSQQVWQDREGDVAVMEGANSTVRHVVRTLRQAKRVETITAASDNRGKISVRMSDNRLLVWEFRNGQIYFGENAATDLMAQDIRSLRFTGFQSDAVTPTTVVNDIAFVQVSAGVTLDRDTNKDRTVTSKVWLRAF